MAAKKTCSDSPSQYCQKLSYGTQATLLQCAEHSEDGELVPASNLLSACSGLNLYYRGAETGEGYTFDGIYKQESTSESTKAIETTATQPVVALDYVSSLGGHPPSCAADIEEACPAIWADMQWAWNTSRPSDYYCGNLLLHSCSEVCLDGNLSPWRYRNWVTRVCKGYLNTYNHHKRRQDFRRHWSAFEPLSEAVYPGLFPWKWRVVNDDMENNNATTQGEQCPSSSAKLGSLAVINILLLFVAMLQSRRTLVQRLTFGKCGKRGSTLWPLMGLISFVLNLTSDLINAVLVHNTPGYGHVPVGSLVLLWSSRPRMAWVAILLVNVQSRDSVYLGSAASAALAETLMQLVGLAYVGRTANYAHQNGLFSASKLANVPHGADATLMYRGAVLVLVAVGFAVLSLLVIIRAMRKNIISRLKGCASGRGTEQSEQETAIPLADLSARRPVADELRKMRLEDDHVPLVYRFAIYMVPLFIGQWLFWAGFIKLAGDLYCPPDVWRITGIWAGFASVGLLFGSAG